MSGNRPTTTADPFKNGSSGSLRYKLGFRSNNNSSAATPLPQSNTSTLPVPAPEITNNLYSTIDQVSTPPVIMNNSTKSSPLRAGVGVGAGGGGMEASLASKSGVHGVGGIPSSSSMNSISGMLSPSSVRKFLGKRIDNNSKSSIVKKPVASSPLTADPESRGGGTMTRNNSSGSTPLSALLSIHGQQFAINNMATTTGGFDPPPTPVSVFPRNMSSSLPTSSIMDSIGRDGGGDGLDFNFSNNFDNSLVSESSDTQHNQSSSNTFGHTLHDMMFGKAATQRSASLNNSTSPSPSSSPLRRTPNRPSPKSYENYNEDQSPSYNIPHNYLNEPNDVSALLGIGDPASVMKNNNSLYKNSQFSSSLPDVGQLDQPSSYTYKEEVDIDSLILMPSHIERINSQKKKTLETVVKRFEEGFSVSAKVLNQSLEAIGNLKDDASPPFDPDASSSSSSKKQQQTFSTPRLKVPSATKHQSPEVVSPNTEQNEAGPKELAKQLCLIDQTIFQKIKKKELQSLSWTRSDKYENAPNIVEMTAMFNQVAMWTANEILHSATPKKRINKIMYYINVAKYCLEFCNFNSLRSILGGLQCTPVYRLQRTWAMIGRKEKALFDRLSELMSSDNNNDLYRKRLRDSPFPCIPYLGLYLGDLTFLNEALKKEKSDTTKSATAAEHRELAISVMLLEIEKYQKTCSYAFDANAPLLMSIKCFKFDTEVENEFYNISYTLEPRQNKQLQTSDQQQQSHSKGNSNENAKWDIMHHLRDLSVTKTMTNAQTSSSSTSPSPYSYTSLKRNQKSAGVISAPTSPAKGNVWVAEPTETSLTNNTADNNNSTFEKSLIRRRKNSEKRKGKKSLFENDSDDTSSSTSGNSQLQQQHQRAKSSSASITSPPKKTSGSQKATITMKSLAGRFRSGSVNREGGAAVLDKQLKILTNKPNSGNNSNNTAPVTMSISPAPLEGFDIGSAFPSYSSDNTGSRITPDAIASSENAIASDDSEYETEEDSIEDDDLMARSAGEDGMPEAPELEGILWEKRLKSDGESGLSFNPKYKWKKKIVVYDDGILTVGKYSKKKLKLLRETYAQAPSYNHTPSSSGEKGSSATNEDLIIVESVEEMDGMGSTSLLEIPAGPTKKLEKFFSTTSLKSVDMSTSVTSAGRDNELQLPEGSDASTSDFNTHQHGLHRLSLDAGGGSRLQKHRSHSSLVGSDGGAHSSRHRGLLSLVNLPSIVTTHNYGNGATTADSRLTKSMGFGRKNGSFHGAGNYGGEESPTGRKRFDILLRRKSAQSIETGGLHQAHPSATTTALQQNLAIISSSSSSSSSHLLQHHPTLPLIADPKRSGHLFGFGSLAGLSEEIRKRAGSFDELKKSGSSTSPFKKTSSESSMPSEKIKMLIPFLVEPLYDVEKSSRVHVDSSSGSTAAAVGVGGSDDTGNSSSTGSLVKKSSKKFKFRLHAKDSKGATIILMFRALSLADYDAWIMAIKANTE